MSANNIQETRALGSLCEDQCSVRGQSQQRTERLYCCFSCRELHWVRHNLPAQRELRWITAPAWILKQVAVSSVWGTRQEFSAVIRGISVLPVLKEEYRRHLEMVPLLIHDSGLFCSCSSFCLLSKSSPALLKRSALSSCLLRHSIKQFICTEIISCQSWLTKCFCSLPYKSCVSFIKPVLVLLGQRMAVIQTEWSLQMGNKCNFRPDRDAGVQIKGWFIFYLFI